LSRTAPTPWIAALVGLLILSFLPAQAQDPPAASMESRVFTVRFKTVDDVMVLLRPLMGEDGSLTMQPRLRAVTVTDEPERLDRMAQVLSTFDVPPRHVRLAVQLLLGSQEPGPEEGDGVTPRSARLPGIDGMLIETLNLTNWPHYRVLGSTTLTVAEGEEATFSLGENYRVRLQVGAVDPNRGVTRFQRFAFERAHVTPDGAREFRSIWDTVLNLRDERLTVFGATRMEDSQRAVFLAVTAVIQE